MDGFDIVSAEDIAAGRATDAYFHRVTETLDAVDRNPPVVAEVSADQFPTGSFEVLAGLKDVAHLLEGIPIDVDALPEGTLFDGGPVLRIEGKYRDFAAYETSLLGFLCHASGVATNALKARMAAPDSTVLSFGSRRIHPSATAMIERSALLAGLDGISHVAAGDILGHEAGGTMPHALMILYGRGNQEEAWNAFNDALPESVPRIALCDTYSDEVDEVLRAVNSLGDSLAGVRLDTTGSRRGDFRAIAEEVRWELDVRGHEDIDLFVSGGLTPKELRNLRDVVDGFGVGSYISGADPIDFALDIIEVEGRPAAKRGKLSGAKSIYRTESGEHHIGLTSRSGPENAESLLQPLIRDGEIVRDFDLDKQAEYTLSDAQHVGFPRR